MSQPEKQGKDRFQYAMNLTLASIAGQVGCLTLVIIFVALFAGALVRGSVAAVDRCASVVFKAVEGEMR